MNLPNGVTEAQWVAALAFIKHPWRPGQRCYGGYQTGVGYCHRCHNCDPHDIPIPAVTDELLMRMLRQGLKHPSWLYLPFLYGELMSGTDPAAAIILAARSGE